MKLDIAPRKSFSLIYLGVAAGLGLAVHQRKRGAVAFCGWILVWLVRTQCITTCSMHPISN